jgi:hypothetical protein
MVNEFYKVIYFLRMCLPFFFAGTFLLVGCRNLPNNTIIRSLATAHNYIVYDKGPDWKNFSYATPRLQDEINEEPICSEYYASVCRPLIQPHDTGSVYDNPYSRIDTLYNQGPVYLYDTIPVEDFSELKPIDTIYNNNTLVKCLQFKYVGNPSGDYYFFCAQINYHNKVYWTPIQWYWVMHDAVEGGRSFSVGNFNVYFIPGN